MSVLLNHSSSVVKVGVLAPQTLEPAVCKQLNKVIVAMIEVMAFWGFVLSLLQLLKQLKLGRTAVTVSVQLAYISNSELSVPSRIHTGE